MGIRHIIRSVSLLAALAATAAGAQELGTRGCQKQAVDACGCHRVFGKRHCHPNRESSHCHAYAHRADPKSVPAT
jgi:hypothetical protein